MITLLTTSLFVHGGSPQAQEPEIFTVVVLPDTQVYLNDATPQPEGTERFQAQTDWLVANAVSENVVFTTHVGDVVQNPERTSEWDRADALLQDLDAAAIPYGVAAGNHDLEPGTDPGLFDQYLSPARFEDNDWYGGYHDASGNRASFQRVVAGDNRILFIHLRHLVATYGDPAEMLDWAADVLAAHPAHLAFITTHEFTKPDGTTAFPALIATTQDSCNVVAVFSGHRFGAAHGTFTDSCGRTIHHMLTNYQGEEGGGDGFMRRLDIDTNTLAAQSTVFSPYTGGEHVGPAEDFALQFDRPNRVFGDVDGSGTIDDLDAIAILEELVGLEPEPFDDLVADRDGDGALSVADALLIAD